MTSLQESPGLIIYVSAKTYLIFAADDSVVNTNILRKTIEGY